MLSGYKNCLLFSAVKVDRFVQDNVKNKESRKTAMHVEEVTDFGDICPIYAPDVQKRVFFKHLPRTVAQTCCCFGNSGLDFLDRTVRVYVTIQEQCESHGFSRFALDVRRLEEVCHLQIARRLV